MIMQGHHRPPPAPRRLQAPFMDAVVKVYCVHTEPNYSLPWQRKRQYTSSSSGFIVQAGKKRWLLTNAHSVDYFTQVKVHSTPLAARHHTAAPHAPACHLQAAWGALPRRAATRSAAAGARLRGGNGARKAPPAGQEAR
jgi:hypothetical protein